MPQASNEDRQQMCEWFGDSISEAGPLSFLEAAGYKLTKDWQWEPKPGVKTFGDMTRKEFECLKFLVHEWDFGGLVEVPA